MFCVPHAHWCCCWVLGAGLDSRLSCSRGASARDINCCCEKGCHFLTTYDLQAGEYMARILATADLESLKPKKAWPTYFPSSVFREAFSSSADVYLFWSLFCSVVGSWTSPIFRGSFVKWGLISHTPRFVALFQNISHLGAWPGVTVKHGDYCFTGTIAHLFSSKVCKVILLSS